MYKKMYFHLFNSITDALAALERQNFGAAAEILRQAQIDSEEIYLDAEDEDEKRSLPKWQAPFLCSSAVGCG